MLFELMCLEIKINKLVCCRSQLNSKTVMARCEVLLVLVLVLSVACYPSDSHSFFYTKNKGREYPRMGRRASAPVNHLSHLSPASSDSLTWTRGHTHTDVRQNTYDVIDKTPVLN
jgi:hypothetical protein